MNNNKKTFSLFNKMICKTILSLLAVVFLSDFALAAGVVSRNTPAAPKMPSRALGATSLRMSSASVITESVNAVNTENISETEQTVVTSPEQTGPIIPDKSEKFSKLFGNTTGGNGDDNGRRDAMRRQLAALGAAEQTVSSISINTAAVTGGASACDDGMRKCMAQKCGSDFRECAGDSDTIWGGKIESCRREVSCDTDEYTASIREIKADRDFNQTLFGFTAVRDCGNRYNSCIIKNCGDGFMKCVSKSGGDNVIESCKSIEQNCTNVDSGLASRAMEIFANLRTQTAKNVTIWETRLYELRDLMATQCRLSGAVLDERSLSCVYTVELVDNGIVPLASKKLAAGSGYTCSPEWFGVDLTTYKENAGRLTSSQKGASAAVLGAGVGTLAGSALSGQLSNTMQKQSDNKEERQAQNEDECAKIEGAKWDDTKKSCDKPGNVISRTVGNASGAFGDIKSAISNFGSGGK